MRTMFYGSDGLPFDPQMGPGAAIGKKSLFAVMNFPGHSAWASLPRSPIAKAWRPLP
jgi:hypothetical protein